MTEDQAIEQLSSYRAKQARIQVLGTYSVGGGIQISRLSEEDHLQQLHRRLRGLPSHLYLSKREQELEAIAHVYLRFYPAGIKAQRAAIPDIGTYEEDDKLLQELRSKIAKVIDARAGCKYDLDEVLERLAELQDLRAEVKRIDDVLAALGEYKPEQARILWQDLVRGRNWTDVAQELSLSKSAYFRLRSKAVRSYIKLAE